MEYIIKEVVFVIPVLCGVRKKYHLCNVKLHLPDGAFEFIALCLYTFDVALKCVRFCYNGHFVNQRYEESND